MAMTVWLAATHFYPRPPRGGRPTNFTSPLHPKTISIHALREEGDSSTSLLSLLLMIFLSTPSARRATHSISFLVSFLNISIHALREEGDRPTCPNDPLPHNFYPRPPRGGRHLERLHQLQSINFYPRPPRGGRRATIMLQKLLKVFLSTPSARRATVTDEEGQTSEVFLSTPSARRATVELCRWDFAELISIHALREEGDGKARKA